MPKCSQHCAKFDHEGNASLNTFKSIIEGIFH